MLEKEKREGKLGGKGIDKADLASEEGKMRDSEKM